MGRAHDDAVDLVSALFHVVNDVVDHLNDCQCGSFLSANICCPDKPICGSYSSARERSTASNGFNKPNTGINNIEISSQGISEMAETWSTLAQRDRPRGAQ